MTYNSEGKRTTLENLAGQVTTTAWDCCHKVSEVQPDGSTTTWDYDAEGRITATSRLIPLDMTNVTWLTTCYRYDDLGRQIATWQTNLAAQVGLPVSRTCYDQLGRVIARVDQLGNTTTTTYSPDGRTVSVLNPNTSIRTTTRSANGDTLSITGTAVTPEFITYGILPDGTRWSRTVQGETAASPRFTKRYENLLDQTIREERSGFKGAVLATVHGYDSLGRLVLTVADYEPTVEYAYDVQGVCFASVSRADGQWRKTETASSFSLLDGNCWITETNIVSCSDSAIVPLVTSSSRQLTGLTASLPAHSRTTDIRGNVTENETLVDSSTVTSRQTLPCATNKPLAISRYGVSLMDVSVSAVTNTVAYDSLGRRIANTDGRGNTRHVEYNSLGQRFASIDALGNRTVYAYDQFGNLDAVTDPLGHAIVYEYDLRGRKIYEGGATYPVRYTYDVFGVTTWLYDEASGSMTNKIYADGKGPTYSYTPDGKLSCRVWARGILTDYVYDGWGNLTNIVYSDDTPTVSLACDALGRQTEARDAAGTTTFLYDSFGSLTNEAVIGVAGTNTVERFYDNFGRDVGYALNGIRQSTLAYDPAAGRLATMLAFGGDTPFTWNYLGGSDLKSALVYPNGLTVSWQYDANNQLLKVCNATPTNTISQYDYAYDAAGCRINVSKSGTVFDQDDTITYGYNARSELTNAVAAVDSNFRYFYDFDDIGNRKTSAERGTNSVYTANSLNQYTTVDDFTPVYDLDGNQTHVKTATGIWQIYYNGENRPILWTQGTNTISMTFDRMGRRVAMNGNRFVYKGYLQIANDRCGCCLWDPTGLSATLPLVWNRQGSYMFYIHDGNKNVSVVVAEHSQVAAHYEYAPFGALTVCRGNLAAENSWRFSSEYAEDDTATVYYNYRHYDPVMGRWFVRDPINEVDIVNLYGWVANRLSIDYLGLIKFSTIDGLTKPCGPKVEETCQKEMDDLKHVLASQLANLSVPLTKGSNYFGDLWYKILDIYNRYGLPTQDPREPVFGDDKRTKQEIEDMLTIYQSIWRSREDLKNNLRKIANEMQIKVDGVEVVCCPQMGDYCKSRRKEFETFGQYFTIEKGTGRAVKSDAQLNGKIIICPVILANDFKKAGGCGCFMMHELMHKYGMSNKKIANNSVKINIEKAMIEIARLILGKECEGYGGKMNERSVHETFTTVVHIFSMWLLFSKRLGFSGAE